MINVALLGFGRIGQMHAYNINKNKSLKLLYVYEKLDILSDKIDDMSQFINVTGGISSSERDTYQYRIKFNVNNFDHKAYFNEKKKRIEMHLISRQNQNISLKNYDLKILKGETIHTENSHKYSVEEFEKLAISSGYKKVDFLTDQRNYFGIFFLKVLGN